MVDYSAQGRRSKRRGKTYERRTAKLLTEFTSRNFRKTPGSGGFNKQGGVTIREELFCGDVICDAPNFAFCVEAKNRKDFSFVTLLKNVNTSSFSSWWYQCVDDAKKIDLLPIMFFKPDNAADFIALDERGMDKLGSWSMPHFKLFIYEEEVTLKIKSRYGKKTETIVTKLPTAFILNWKTIINTIDPEKFFDFKD